ncbi:MAG: T9SS type A sorting domain-containing protein [Candidatus Eisenbacteria bacterium]|nr:T9SS type A sorting domain-containing protein [Candidatus Eisenbacteria bacterium]
MSIVTTFRLRFLPALRRRTPAILAMAVTVFLLYSPDSTLAHERWGESHQPDSLGAAFSDIGTRPGDAGSPPRIDPMGVVRMVDGNRSAMAKESPLVAGDAGTGEVGPPFLIGAETVYGPVRLDQRSVAVASDGSNYLVVWSDARNSYDAIYGDIYAARVTASGEVLDPCGIPVSTALGSQRWPSVSFDGTNYLVVWEDERNYEWDIYGTRVSVSGDVLDPDGVPIYDASGDQFRPTIAFDGMNYMVAWQDWRSGSPDIYGARVEKSLHVLDPTGIPFCVSVGDQYYPEIAFGAGSYLVVWQDRRSGSNWDIYGTRVSTSGTVLDPSGIAVLTGLLDEYTPDVASDGTGYMVVWADGRKGGGDVECDIYGTRINTSGNVLDPGGIAISTASYMQHWPAIAYDGANYVVVWEDKRNGLCDIYATRVSASGSVIDPSGLLVSSAVNEQYFPALAFNGTSYLVVWDDYRTSKEWNTFGARLTTSGDVLDTLGIIISSVVNELYWPAVAFDGKNYLVVWYDTRTGSMDIYGARVDTSGNVLDPDAISISTAQGDQALPSVAFDGTNYMVVWEDYRSLTGWNIYGARVDTAGSVLDPSGIPISTASGDQYAPSLAFDGTNYLVTWADARSSGVEVYCDIYGARVSTSGTVLDTNGFAISAEMNMQHWPAVAFDGTNYMVVWQDTRDEGDSHIYATRVTPSAEVLEPQGILVSAAATEEYLPAIEFDGTNYFAVWEDNRSGTDFDVCGARLTPAGVVLDPGGIVISMAPFHQLYPCLVFDGTTYVVAWQDLRSGIYFDVYAARVKPSGVVLDPAGVPISSGAEHELYPAACTSRPGSFFIAYSSYVPVIGSCSSYRITGNMWSGVSLVPQCIGYWAFDEGEGGVATDSALANHGVVYDAAWTEGIRGSALSFNGVNSYVRIPNISAYNLANEVSVEAWVQMTPSQTSSMPHIFDKSHRGGVEPPYYSGYALCGSVDEDYSLAFAACNSSSCFESNSVVALNDGKWHFIAGTVSSRDSVICFYLDGELTMERPFEGSLGVNDGDVFVGRWWYGGNCFSGIIDEVKIYGSVLGPDEIWQHYEDTYVGVDDDFVAPRTPRERVFLAQNFPNPFNPATLLSFYLVEAAHVKLSVFDIGGSEVSVLWQGPMSSGWHTLNWNAPELASGVYFVRLDAGEIVKTRKAVLLK